MMRGCWSVALMVASFAVSGADWIPSDVQKDIVPGSALDFSGLGLQDAPAGKHGSLRVVGDHFEFVRLPGVAQRFYGANLCFSANFPEPSLAVRMADRFRRIGYNAVRIHHYDRACMRMVDGELRLDEKAMARLDFLAAEFIRRGIYLTTDLYVSRKPTWKDIGETEQGDGKCPFKVLALCHEGAFRNWCAFARLFLKHVNPHTGRAWGEEPALLFLPLVNEGAFSNPKTWASLARIPAFRAAFAKWIRQERERASASGRWTPSAIGRIPYRVRSRTTVSGLRQACNSRSAPAFTMR